VQQAVAAAQPPPVDVEVVVVVLVEVGVAVLVLPSAEQTPWVQLVELADVSLQAELSVTGSPPVQVMVVTPEPALSCVSVPVAIVAPEAFLNVRMIAPVLSAPTSTE
jgi:hypothetical protein